jgi:hypothetical protein
MKPVAVVLLLSSLAAAETFDYRLLATSRTSTMEKEMNEAADAGYVYAAVMGGETAFGGKEAVVVMAKSSDQAGKRRYKLLATSKTSTMQKELNEAGEEGWAFRGQTVFESAFGGREVCVILERDTAKPAARIQYRLLATSKTSTMQKELNEAGADGYQLLSMGVGKTAFGGNEVVCILWKKQR